jgi:hypothetical protein
MPVPANIFLSKLQPLAACLAQGVDIDSGLMDVLQDALPEKQADKLAKLLREGDDALKCLNRDVDPYAWLATSDHLEVVQTFRELL